MSETETETTSSGKKVVYATQAVVRDGITYQPGDELQHHCTPEMQRSLLQLGRASYERPAGVTPVYALVRLSWHPHTLGYQFEPGDRIDGILPAVLVKTCVENGSATLNKPEVTR
jgi:hypothetical protein